LRENTIELTLANKVSPRSSPLIEQAIVTVFGVSIFSALASQAHGMLAFMEDLNSIDVVHFAAVSIQAAKDGQY